MSSHDHGIENILGPDIAEVSQSTDTATSRMERRIELESAGIIFPSLETEWSVLMQKARAAQRRGFPLRAEDGSVILPEGEIQPLNHSQRLEQHNEERLKKMYKFELISQASEFARDRLNDRHGFDESRNENITFVQDTFKQYVQLLTRLEDWDKPWQQAVDTHLRGKGLAFPLTVTELEKAVFDFTVNPLSINAEQYHSIGLYTFVLRTKLENRLAEHLKKRNQIDRGALAHAASASLHYVHSPISAVRFAAERVPLIDGFDWPTEIIRASNNRAEFFLP